MRPDSRIKWVKEKEKRKEIFWSGTWWEGESMTLAIGMWEVESRFSGICYMGLLYGFLVCICYMGTCLKATEKYWAEKGW